MQKIGLVLVVAVLLVWAVGCSEDDTGSVVEVQAAEGDEVTADENTAVVVVDGESYVVTGDLDSEDCVEIDGVCVDFDAAGANCDDEALMDVVVVDGEVVEVICYPPANDENPIEEVVVTDGEQATIPSNSGHLVIGFSEESNGEPIPGDLTIDGEQTALYGNGIDETIIDGSVSVLSNNSNVRSLTVMGDVTYANNSNNSSLAYCKVEGSLLVESNEFVGMKCQVFGDVTITGNKAHLIDIGVGGAWNVDTSTECQGCYSFDDANEDKTVADDELGDELLCE